MHIVVMRHPKSDTELCSTDDATKVLAACCLPHNTGVSGACAYTAQSSYAWNACRYMVHSTAAMCDQALRSILNESYLLQMLQYHIQKRYP